MPLSFRLEFRLWSGPNEEAYSCIRDTLPARYIRLLQ